MVMRTALAAGDERHPSLWTAKSKDQRFASGRQDHIHRALRR